MIVACCFLCANSNYTGRPLTCAKPSAAVAIEAAEAMAPRGGGLCLLACLSERGSSFRLPVLAHVANRFAPVRAANSICRPLLRLLRRATCGRPARRASGRAESGPQTGGGAKWSELPRPRASALIWIHVAGEVEGFGGDFESMFSRVCSYCLCSQVTPS